MLNERRSPYFATVGLIDGGTKIGRVAGFLPRDPEISLELVGAGGQKIRVPLPTETVAYVGLHRSGRTGAKLADRDRVLRKVHLPGGRSFIVEVRAADIASRLGFYCLPAESQSQFEEIFFYTQGVNAVEDVELIGTMLVDGGLVNKQDLERGLAEHAARRNVPIGQILLEQKKIAPASLEDAVAIQARRRMRLGEVLIEEKLATKEDIDAALVEQKKRAGKRLGDVLVEMNIVSEKDLAITLARKFNIPFIDLDQCAVNPAAATEVSAEIITKYCVLPVDADAHAITLAIGDPLAMEAVDLLRFQANKQVREVIVVPSQLRRYVDRHLEARQIEELGGVDRILEELAGDEQPVVEEQNPLQGVEVQESDSAVIKLANQIIMDAYRAGASDIHIEPNGRERSAVVRFRVDGDCVAYRDIPPAYRRSLVARIKIMAQLDISERRKPQDGKIRLQLKDRPIELRVATIPTVGDNEDVVMRILANARPLPLERMGMGARNLAALRSVIAKPYGLVLCVGPTGSGKTTTLHSALGAINNIDMKIWTAEDPVEITQAGLRQVQMNPKIGLTFATALRSFLRADPDVIMIGEMRDHETAQIAVESSLTGHLVLSTLHTNSASETITRLLDMGLDPFNFGDALLGVLAQRLTRTLCKACRETYPGTRAEWDEIVALYGEKAMEERLGRTFGPSFMLARAKGCDECSGTGYRGRMAIHELLVNDERTKPLIARRAPVAEIRKAAMEGGMTTLLEDGIEKALAGHVDVRQVLAVAAR